MPGPPQVRRPFLSTSLLSGPTDFPGSSCIFPAPNPGISQFFYWYLDGILMVFQSQDLGGVVAGWAHDDRVAMAPGLSQGTELEMHGVDILCAFICTHIKDHELVGLPLILMPNQGLIHALFPAVLVTSFPEDAKQGFPVCSILALQSYDCYSTLLNTFTNYSVGLVHNFKFVFFSQNPVKVRLALFLPSPSSDSPATQFVSFCGFYSHFMSLSCSLLQFKMMLYLHGNLQRLLLNLLETAPWRWMSTSWGLRRSSVFLYIERHFQKYYNRDWIPDKHKTCPTPGDSKSDMPIFS